MSEGISLHTHAESEAKKAEALPAFSGFNLLHIKRQVATLLGLIGRDGIFDQYTVHDISHIDHMLTSLDWIIPEATKSIMSPTDWLMTVLAIYFHDMGMLVTAEEYDKRAYSDFPRYRDETLFAGNSGADYRAKVGTLPPDRAERFLYQEFVRHKHAERIRAWVIGHAREDLGIADNMVEEIDALLNLLGPQFRRDLGLICESHHLNDLNDLKKYKPSQPYGNSDAETANLQYCAVLLRTADLLHVTSNRTPSVAFRVINPTDPISQQEWAKQMAVTRVRPKLGTDDEGVPSETAPKDTVEVHAYFRNEDGFFGLTSFLSYASDELKKSHEWISNTKKHQNARHEFPWRKIDDSNIETEGFIRDTFEFAINQTRILDLLTGHTLYNDTRVVLRELVQNAIDAIRIQHFPDPPTSGKIQLEWDTKDRTLKVTDNGTGMTQRVISDFLLNVGTSRYQDPEFKKEYPTFESISRFGIGVLSTFMVADSVDVITCHPEDEQARQLTLRSVHGKYLIRFLDKSHPDVQRLAPHGTQFVLKVRPSVEMPDVLETAKLWIVVPDCEVTGKVDSQPSINIGHKSPAGALIELLSGAGIRAEIGHDTKAPQELDSGTVRVIERESNGVTVAYAIEWTRYFREWSFVTADRLKRGDSPSLSLGTCIEGIRVETATPGFKGTSILSIANVKGPNAPKTNVARSGLEITPERDAMLREIYGIYRNHVAQEITELHSNRSFSLTWAVSEAQFLLAPILDASDGEALSSNLFEEALSELRVLPVETKSGRTAISPASLAREPEFWTIDCALFHIAEPLIREAGKSASLSGIVETLNVPGFQLPPSKMLCGVRPSDYFGSYAYRKREVDRIVIFPDQRRIDLRWVPLASPSRWLSPPNQVGRFYKEFIRDYFSHRSVLMEPILVGIRDIDVSPMSEQVAVSAFGRFFLLPGTPVANYMQQF